MAAGDMIGWLAAGLTLVTFSMRSMLRLRLAALAANVCFIAYGFASGLYPVLVLHALLLPCNAVRLWQLRRLQPDPAGDIATGSRTEGGGSRTRAGGGRRLCRSTWGPHP